MWTKRKTKWSIRLRITLLVSLLLAMITLIFTGYSIYSSRRHFALQPMSQMLVSACTPSIPLDKSIHDSAIERNDSISFEPSVEQDLLLEAEAEPIPISVATTVVQNAQRSFGFEQILALCLVNLLGIIGTYLVLGRALRPLTRLSQEMEGIHEHKLSVDLPVPSTEDEIGSLTRSFNAMLTRLRQSFEVQRNFASNAAHELKTPLTVMKSSLQVLDLEENAPISDYQETTNVCAETVEQMIQIVNDLLFISSVQNEAYSTLIVPELITQAIHVHQDGIEEKELLVEVNCQVMEILSNQTLLYSIIENLLSNAVKYNKEGGEIAISATQDKSAVILTVTDTGIGVPEDDLPYIFESFYRVDPSRSKETEGNGLGLQIVKAATERLSGTVEVQSKEEKGTTFTITLPLH